jgi:hypothetical protein
MCEKIKFLMKCARPIISERHDFSATVYKNKDTHEPIFHVASKGDSNIDILKVISWLAVAILALSAFSLSSRNNESRKRKIKKLKAELREARRLER